MRKIFTVLASWTVLMAACASFTSCGDDDDDDSPKKENNSDKTVSVNEKTLDTASSVCKDLGDVFRNGNDKVFTYMGSLMSVDFKDGKAVSLTHYVASINEAYAKLACQELQKELDKFDSAYVVGKYVAVVSTDPEDLKPYEGKSIVEVENLFKNFAYNGED